MTVVIFDPFIFKTRYPEFNAVQNPTLAAFFADATLYLSNQDNSPVQNVVRRLQLLNMLTAHIAALSGAAAGGDGKPLPVGRIASATEGSVTVAFDYNATPGSQSWFDQTQYGAAFWQATSSLRGFRYRIGPGLGNGAGPGIYGRRYF